MRSQWLQALPSALCACSVPPRSLNTCPKEPRFPCEVKQACSSSCITSDFSNKLPMDSSTETAGYFLGEEGWLLTNIRQLSGQLQCQGTSSPLHTGLKSKSSATTSTEHRAPPEVQPSRGLCTHNTKPSLHWLSNCRAKACILSSTRKGGMRPTDVLTSSHNTWTILTGTDQMPVPAQLLYPCLEHNTNCSHWLGLCSKKDTAGRGGGMSLPMTEHFETLQWSVYEKKNSTNPKNITSALHPKHQVRAGKRS